MEKTKKKSSLKLTQEHKKVLKRIEKFYLRKGFRSLNAVCKKVNVDRSNAVKALVGIHKHEKAKNICQTIFNEIGYKQREKI